MIKLKTTALILSVLFSAVQLLAQDKRTYKAIDESIPTGKVINSKIGKLSFPLGYPTDKTAQMLEDEMLYINAVNAYNNTIQGASLWALRKGFASIGVNDGDFIVSPEMVDGKALMLTANMDTYYFWGNVDLSNGPLVVETPPNVLGILDDFWFNWISDFGLAGPDKGQGGKFLIIPQGYEGDLPEGGYNICHAKTNLVTVLGRMFLVDNSTETSINTVKEHLKVYPYVEGAHGTSVAKYLSGEAPLARPSDKGELKLVDVSGKDFNTLPPADYNHFIYINELIQSQPVGALSPEIAGQLAALGIVKGKEFNPSEKQKQILTKAVQVANAYSRTAAMGALPNNKSRYYEESSSWYNPLFDGGYTFMTPPPEIGEKGEVIPYPSDGARKLAARTSFFYLATGITPAMCMRLTGIGSQYLVGATDSEGNALNGKNTYKLTLPPNIPQERFWSTTIYDNQTRSMIQTDQRYPRAGSQSYPSSAAEANEDGSITIYYGPNKPEGVADGNWVQTIPNKGWFQIIRCYSPSKGFFDKSWRPSEVELVK
ncbi:DUF1254 domain-containing protein [Flammeovirga pacifica]|uniref:DUF1254 domain-containing protein n=1 Tax=Flammeovirga pacifica TaxID=915059 RepID=A0A1S1YUK9_FLAPC|nr:DUF1254 domain-containing protein [Flammeovirga pacifica]OHX64553.1 hypothetical protein NH26_23560 [Flammeovirga pacifica]